MKVLEVMSRVSGSGEYVLGADATGSHACYLIYGVVKAGEKGRVLNPGKGHEEMILAVRGDLKLRGACTGTLKQGQAVHLVGEQACWADNEGEGDAVYVAAGGHVESGHHH